MCSDQFSNIKKHRDNYFSGLGHWFGFELGVVFGFDLSGFVFRLEFGFRISLEVRVCICIWVGNRILVFITEPVNTTRICVRIWNVFPKPKLKKVFVFFLFLHIFQIGFEKFWVQVRNVERTHVERTHYESTHVERTHSEMTHVEKAKSSEDTC